MELEDHYLRGLLARLDGLGVTPKDSRVSTPAESVAADAGKPVPVAQEAPAGKGNRNDSAAPAAAAPIKAAAPVADQSFVPQAPASLADTKVPEALIEALVLKFLLKEVTATGRAVADELGFPLALLQGMFSQLKSDQLVVYRGTAALGDYVYQLTTQGTDAALRLLRQGSYVGGAPVHFDEYVAAVKAQSVSNHLPKMADLQRVFGSLNLDEALLTRIGQALDAGKGFFLYGAPGNGKTSIAERVSEVFGQYVWIPRTICIDGHVVRLFDPCNHVEAPLAETESRSIDRRWVRIRRPAIVVGGELTLDRLEIVTNQESGISEAPLQLKSNCGTLVIDDFGRQRVSSVDLLNRWIVPLDRAYDLMQLPGGKTVRVPFEQMLIFSTNLQPNDLVDEAFLRRIPYKIEVLDPTEAEFRRLLENYADAFKVRHDRAAVEHLLEKHYRRADRPLRRCHARDLIAQIHHFCRFSDMPARMTAEHFDMAAANYFALNPTCR